MYFQYLTESNAKEETIHNSICVRFLRGKNCKTYQGSIKAKNWKVDLTFYALNTCTSWLAIVMLLIFCFNGEQIFLLPIILS